MSSRFLISYNSWFTLHRSDFYPYLCVSTNAAGILPWSFPCCCGHALNCVSRYCLISFDSAQCGVVPSLYWSSAAAIWALTSFSELQITTRESSGKKSDKSPFKYLVARLPSCLISNLFPVFVFRAFLDGRQLEIFCFFRKCAVSFTIKFYCIIPLTAITGKYSYEQGFTVFIAQKLAHTASRPGKLMIILSSRAGLAEVSNVKKTVSRN